VGGATFLAWALAGADQLGTPGFRDLNGNKGAMPANFQLDVIGGCTDDTGSGVINNTPGLYYVNPLTATSNPGKPYYPRSGPYVEPSKVKFPKMKKDNQGKFLGFEVPVGGHSLLPSICFLDAFDQPILYYKATPTATYMAAAGRRPAAGNTEQYAPAATNGSAYSDGVYNMLDNGGSLVGTPPADGTVGGNLTGMDGNPGIELGGGAVSHFNGGTLGDPTKSVTSNPVGSFVQHIGNPGVATTPTPHNASSYILLSAGADGVFGTADDLANFPIAK
jgi:hypothetical protein